MCLLVCSSCCFRIPIARHDTSTCIRGASPSFGYAVLAVCQSAELCSEMSVFTYLKTENCYIFCSSLKADLYGFMEALMFTPRLTMPYHRLQWCLFETGLGPTYKE
ncbi:unnamed protein product [Sphagnum troendelagicum]|uniref:Secreted protein n=1 Tax=Sphagnum troendelagicum TaxID=128251 RepID=A0ABP0UNZ3_9BRYO